MTGPAPVVLFAQAAKKGTGSTNKGTNKVDQTGKGKGRTGRNRIRKPVACCHQRTAPKSELKKSAPTRKGLRTAFEELEQQMGRRDGSLFAAFRSSRVLVAPSNHYVVGVADRDHQI